MSAAKLAGILLGVFISLAGAFLLHLSQTPAVTTEAFITTAWSSETGLAFDRLRPIRPGEKTELELRSEPIHMRDWVQVGFTIAEGTLDILVRDHDGKAIREMSDASGRVKIAFFAPREAIYYLSLTNSKSNTSATVLDFDETIYTLTRPLLTRRVETAPSMLTAAASFVIIALGVAAAAYAFKQARE